MYVGARFMKTQALLARAFMKHSSSRHFLIWKPSSKTIRIPLTQTRPADIRVPKIRPSGLLPSLVGATVYLALSARPPGSPTDIRRTLRSPLVEVCARCVRHEQSCRERRGQSRTRGLARRGHPLVSPAQPASSPDQVKENEWRRTRAAILAATKTRMCSIARLEPTASMHERTADVVGLCVQISGCRNHQ